MSCSNGLSVKFDTGTCMHAWLSVTVNRTAVKWMTIYSNVKTTEILCKFIVCFIAVYCITAVC